jgi:hypothetical protein
MDHRASVGSTYITESCIELHLDAMHCIGSALLLHETRNGAGRQDTARLNFSDHFSLSMATGPPPPPPSYANGRRHRRQRPSVARHCPCALGACKAPPGGALAVGHGPSPTHAAAREVVSREKSGGGYRHSAQIRIRACQPCPWPIAGANPQRVRSPSPLRAGPGRMAPRLCPTPPSHPPQGEAVAATL